MKEDIREYLLSIQKQPLLIKFSEILPDLRLSKFIKYYWFFERTYDANKASKQHIVPDGCMDLILQYQDPFQLNGDKTISLPHATIIGPTDQFRVFKASATSAVLGIRFYPWGASAFLSNALKEFRHGLIDAQDVLGNVLEPVIELAHIGYKKEAIDKLNQFFLNKIKDYKSVPGIIPELVFYMQNQPELRIQSLAKAFDVNSKRLERLFNQHIGITAKQLQKIYRYQLALQIILDTPLRSISSIAHQCGYFDEAHMINDFHQLHGQTPGVIKKRRLNNI